jgi:DNA-binding NarL/FixJ family response regulator
LGQQGPRTRVLIVDNLAAVREGLAALLTAEGDFEVVGEADSAEEAVRQALESRPDLVLLEVELPNQEAEASLQRLEAAGLDAALVALGLNGDSARWAELCAGPCDGYIQKGARPEEVLRTVRAALRRRRAP